MRRFSVRRDGVISWIQRMRIWNTTALYIMRWKEHFLHRRACLTGWYWMNCSRIQLMLMNQAEIRMWSRISAMSSFLHFTRNIIIRPTAISICMVIWIWKRSLYGWIRNIWVNLMWQRLIRGLLIRSHLRRWKKWRCHIRLPVRNHWRKESVRIFWVLMTMAYISQFFL